MKKITYILTILFLLISFPNIAEAKKNDSQLNVCLNNRLYSVLYDSTKPITRNMIGIGEDGKPRIINDGTLDEYEITFTELGTKCRNDGDSIINCPEDGSIYTYKNIRTAYLNDDTKTETTTINSDNIILNFNQSTGKFNVTIKDKFNDKVYIRYVSDEKNLNVSDDDDISRYLNQFLNRSNGNYYINGVDGQSIVYLEFYIKDSNSKCKDTYIGYISFSLPSAYDYELDNPALSSPSDYGCDAVKNYKPDAMKIGSDEYENLFLPMKKNYIHECYAETDKKLPFGSIGIGGSTLKNTINSKLEKLKDLFSDYQISESKDDKICTDLYSTSPKVTYASSGKYWAMVCTEKYTATGDEAKLVKAGEGFEYQANYTITRQCKLSQISKPTKLPKCEYELHHSCDWNMSNGTRKGCSGADCDGGPNDDFDICVKECDNGKYSQECINACYQSVYSSDRKLSISNSSLTKDGRIQFVSLQHSQTFTQSNTNISCTTAYGRAGYLIYYQWPASGTPKVSGTACFSTNFCAGKGAGACTFNTYKTPDNCAEDPETTYKNALAASKSEYEAYINYQQSSVPSGTYTYQITDSFLKTGKKTGNDDNSTPYVFEVKSNDNFDPKVKVDKSESKTGSDYKTETLGNSGGESVSYYENYTVKADIKTSLPLSYVNKITGGTVYKSDETTKNNAYEIFQNESGTRKLRKVQQEGTSPTSESHPITEFIASRYYHQDNERKYYTSIWSQNTNVLILENRVYLKPRKDINYNIKVISSKVGAGEFGSTIDCYYGVYNSYYCDNKDDCPVPECKENCPDPTGIQYIYRVIDLTDVFPNDRNPRWNWTSSAARKASETRIGYNIDPIAKTKDIESKGESIYTDQNETDYEFYLTRENIRNIRDYNKHVKDYNNDGSNNYLDYNMSCYIDAKGRQICTSRFLDNINGNSGSEESSNYITYGSQFTIDSRKALAGCNDAIGQSCNDKYN